MIGVWGQHAGLFLEVLAVGTLGLFGLPMLFWPLRWAAVLGWRIPEHTHLAIYFGRCLGAVICVLGGFAFRVAAEPAFTTFLPALNSGGCFAGQCDWRQPTIAEVQTIMLAPYPCTTSPCIDEGLFGPTIAGGYWTATTNGNLPGFAWVVNFSDGDVVNINKDGADYVRAVRGGL
jgi:hypothetical protein